MLGLKVNKYQFSRCGLVIILMLMHSSLVFSDDDVNKGIIAMNGKFYPVLRSDVLYTDNVLLQDNNAKESILIVTAPRLKYRYEGNITQFSMDMGIENGYYTHSHSDNYLDADTKASFSVYPTSRLSFFGNAGYKRFHEARGSGSQSGIRATEFGSPDKYRLWEAQLGLKYGVEEVGMPRVEVAYYHDERRYTNNRRRTRIQDRNTDRVNSTVFYQLFPNTSLLIQGNLMRVAYKKGFAPRVLASPGDLDSRQYSILGGVTWRATYQTEGFFKVGWNQKFFDVSDRGTSSNLSWEVGVNWFPLSYSTVGLVTSQRLQEADGLGNDANVRTVRLAWTHGWGRGISTTANFFYINSDYSGNTREDKDFGGGLSVDYEFRRWLSLGVDYKYILRSSTGNNLDYERNIFGVHMVLSL